jgi:hypothetical protein
MYYVLAIRISASRTLRERGYTNEVRLRGLQGFQPAQAGFVCVAANCIRLVQDIFCPFSPLLILGGLGSLLRNGEIFEDDQNTSSK